MFITTIRLRRARPATLDSKLSTKQLQQLRKAEQRPNIVEVMAHGQVVALVHVSDDAGLATLWVHRDVEKAYEHHERPESLQLLVKASLALMGAAADAGITRTDHARVDAAAAA